MNKRESYEGYRKYPDDKIYMMMNRKDVEAHQKTYDKRCFSKVISTFETCCSRRVKGEIK